MPRQLAVGLETIEELRQTRLVLHDVNHLARRFADADKDGNRALDFSEWARGVLPKPMCAQFTESTLRAWFKSADLDGDGRLSVEEYFIFALSFACDKLGVDAVVRLFQRYDPDRSGCLDLFEWQRACEDAGFGSTAHSIFRSLDPDFSGTVDYRELGKVLKATSGATGQVGRGGKLPPGITPTALKQAAALRASLIETFDVEASAERHRILSAPFEQPTSPWGSSALEVYGQLQKALQDSGGLVADLVGLFDVDADDSCVIDGMEFVSAMRNRFGYGGPLHVLDHCFECIDQDSSGGIGFDELFEFIRGRRHSLDRRHKQLHQMTMKPPRGAGYALKDVEWDNQVLRLMMQRMIDRFGCGPADLIQLWDRNGDLELTESEFLSQMQTLFSGAENQLVWRSEVEPIAKWLFRRMATSTGGEAQVYGVKLSVTELEVWLRAPPEGELAMIPADAPPPLKQPVAQAMSKRSGRRRGGKHRSSSSLSSSQQQQQQRAGPSRAEREQASARKREEERIRILRHALDYSSYAGRPSTRRVAKLFPGKPRRVLVEHGARLAEDHADFWGEAQGRFMSPRLPSISPSPRVAGGAGAFSMASDLPRTTAIQPPGSYVGRVRISHVGGSSMSVPHSPRKAGNGGGAGGGATVRYPTLPRKDASMSLPDSPRKARVMDVSYTGRGVAPQRLEMHG